MKNKNESHEENHNSYMVRRNLFSINKAVKELLAMVDENAEIESWMEHKISVAKAALSDVRDAYAYDMEHGHDEDDDVEITVLRGDDAPKTDDFGLNKMMGGCGANEHKSFLGSGAINENKVLITNNSNIKVLVESIENQSGLIKVTTKSGKSYEYLPHFGAELEMLRCEGYGIKIKNEMFSHDDEDEQSNLKKDMYEFLKARYPGEDESSIEVAIYWFAYNHHEGQFSDLYSVLSTSDYKPSRLTHNIDDEDDEVAKAMYEDLIEKFA